MTHIKTLCCAFILFASIALQAQKKTAPRPAKAEKKVELDSALISGLQFRSLGPATTSGRVVDIAVNPKNVSEYYVASAAGGVWKTANAGTTYSPVFDNAVSFSIGCLAIDPNNTNVVWVGTGENNNQRSAAYGDGIYKSEDGGKSWKNMGLKKSEHIGQIAIDPTNGDIVYAAAYGPLWNSGGERGVYKTSDGGKTWKQALKVNDHTGFNEVMIDPRNPNMVYAAAHQRQRKGFTYIGGGPESALYKSADGGITWNKMMNGLPKGDNIGRIGLTLFPANPDILYCIAEAAEDKGGVFKSKDRGASWEKQSGYSTSGNYYQRIFCDPKNENRLYVMDVFLQVSHDGGKTFSALGEKNKHVDNHVIWIDPNNTQHCLVGCDGGVYESFDGGSNWNFKANLPVTQFYKVAADNAAPFYHLHGGTQDNFSIGGPSRTLSANGIMNSDWYFTSTGDGYESQADPSNPDIVYAQAQYGALRRYDKKSGESLFIQPQEPEGEAYRWNWDAPLVLSKYDNKRLYHAANKVFRTDDQGNTWKTISPDLSRQIDRNKLPVMGRVWGMDAVEKNKSTDIYGNITSIAESKFDENTLYAGTDDGLIQVTVNGGAAWTKIDNIPGVPERTYVNLIITSNHDKDAAYVTFNHHRYGDFRPYVYKTSDGGKTWKSISGNLPSRGTAYCIAEDHVNKNLLFVGTEFGVFVTLDGGGKWIPMKGGLPPATIKDMEIQKRENDLALATFGRGFYVLDDYTPLRSITKEALEKPAVIFPIKDALMFIQSKPLGVNGKGFQGESFFTSPNPPVGAVFTYYLKDSLKTIKEKRKETEAERIKKGKPLFYPSADSMRLEDEQPEPHLLFTIADEAGQTVRRIKAPAKKGLHRIVWDFRTSAFGPVDFTAAEEAAFRSPEQGYLALPGNYTVSLAKFEDGVYAPLTPPQPFKAIALNNATLPAADKKALDEFCKKIAALKRVVAASNMYRAELANKLRYMKQAIIETPKQTTELSAKLEELNKRLNDVNRKLNGNASLSNREFETPPSIVARIRYITGSLWNTTAAQTQTQKDSYRIAAKEFKPVYAELRAIAEEINKAEGTLEKNNAPYTPGRIPEWREE